MALRPRRTAILKLRYGREDARLSLDTQRRYETTLVLDEVTIPCQPFSTPFGEEEWWQIVTDIRSTAAEQDSPDARARNTRRAEDVRNAGLRLYQAIAGLSPELRKFLDADQPRRLVIESLRAEIHSLPWEAMADESDRHLAATDLSVVRCREAFFAVPQVPLGVLRFFYAEGPGVGGETVEAVRSVKVKKEGDRQAGIEIVADKDADLVHIEAHGDQFRTLTTLARGDVTPRGLADLFPNRLMVLLWSCFSGRIDPAWEVSPAMALHERGSTFVLGFVSPLHFSASGAIAKWFYDDVFGAGGHQDPEQAVTTIRARLFKEQFEFCDWASMTLWLRRPVDLSLLPLGRIRVPAADWGDGPVKAVDERVRRVFDKEAALGDARLRQGTAIPLPLPRDLVREWSGPVVHLNGVAALDDDRLFEELGVALPRTAATHRADRFLALLDHLATYRYALLVWSRVTTAEALLVQTLDSIPPNVGIVLFAPYALEDVWSGHVVVEGDAGARKEPVPKGLAGFLHFVNRDRFREALQRPLKIDTVEYWANRYLAAVKIGDAAHLEEAKASIARVKQLDAIEGMILEANFESREARHRAARDLYNRAADEANRKNAYSALGRIYQDLAYVAADMGDRGLADERYRNALDLLPKARAKDRDSLWTSALGRALRDYADLLAEEGRREAEPLLRRATAVHALEGRISQVAYCFVTRSKLQCRLGEWDAAERSAQQAAIVFDRVGNQHGWVEATRLIARSAMERSRYAAAIAVLRRAVNRRLRRALAGRLLLPLAEAQWAAGQIDAAAADARRAAALLPEAYRRERADARRLLEAATSLGAAPPRVAALSGRRLDGMDGRGGSADAERLRARIAECLLAHRIEVLVSSAARGADLLALDAAGALGIVRHIVLPSSPASFRRRSVADAGDDWGERYDAITAAVKAEDATRIQVLDGGGNPFGRANTEILQIAESLSPAEPPVAVVVWDGRASGPDDWTAAFRAEAAARGLQLIDVPL